MKNEKIRNGESNDKRDYPYDDGELYHIHVKNKYKVGFEKLDIVEKYKCRNYLEVYIIKKTYYHDCYQRNPKENE
jgi:hypothetical protein